MTPAYRAPSLGGSHRGRGNHRFAATISMNAPKAARAKILASPFARSWVHVAMATAGAITTEKKNQTTKSPGRCTNRGRDTHTADKPTVASRRPHTSGVRYVNPR